MHWAGRVSVGAYGRSDRGTNDADWGIAAFAPDDLRDSSGLLLDWLGTTVCSRVAIHFDVDVVDRTEVILRLGAAPNGLTGQP